MLDTAIGTILSLSTLSYVSIFGYVLVLSTNTSSLLLDTYVDPHAFSRKEEPKTVYATDKIEQFGVIWKGKFGMWVDPQRKEELDPERQEDLEPYTYVYGPYCPHDDTELGVGIVRTQRLRTEPVWKCDTCDRTYSYPINKMGDGSMIEREMRGRFEEQRRHAQQAA